MFFFLLLFLFLMGTVFLIMGLGHQGFGVNVFLGGGGWGLC